MKIEIKIAQITILPDSIKTNKGQQANLTQRNFNVLVDKAGEIVDRVNLLSETNNEKV